MNETSEEIKGRKITFTIRVSGVVLYALLFFAVLFDPTGLAIGNTLFTLPATALVFAQIIGNIVWIFGLMCVFLGGLIVFMISNDDLADVVLSAAIINGAAKNYAKTFYSYMLTSLALVGSIIAIGSGFWFTGNCWLAATIAARVLHTHMRNKPAFIEYKENGFKQVIKQETE